MISPDSGDDIHVALWSLARCSAADHIVILAVVSQMDHGLQYSPFISISDDIQQLLSEGVQRDDSLDNSGKSMGGELYRNVNLDSVLYGSSVLPTTVPSQQAGRIEAASTIGQTQTIARLEPLIACISRLCSKRRDSQVPYQTVKQEMRGRKAEIKSLGWSDFGMLMEAAYKENVVEPIRGGGRRKSKIKSLRLIPQSLRPRPLPQVEPTEYSMAPNMPCITSIALEAGHAIGTSVNAMDYPLEHRPVVVTMLRLTSVAPGAGVPMAELAKVLGSDYPCREGDYYLILRAEEDGILSTGEYSDSWAYLNSPPAHTTPSSMSLSMLPPIPVQNPTLQLTSTMAGTSHDTFRHPLVTSTILELTGGAWDTKVQLVDLIASLLRSCAEGMVLPLLSQAKQDGLTMDETDAAGVIWVRLRNPPHTSFTAPSNYRASPPPEPASSMPILIPNTALLGGPGLVTSVLETPTPEDSPLAHHEVVSTIIKLSGGTMGEKVRLADLASSLAHDFPRSQGPWYLIFQAQQKGILRQEMGGTGVTWAYLKHPPASVLVPPLPETAALLTCPRRHVPQSGLIQLPTRVVYDQANAMKATASISAPLASPKKNIIGTIPYSATGNAANAMRKDGEETSSSKVKISGAEAQESNPHISPEAIEKEVHNRTQRGRHGRRPSLELLDDPAFKLMAIEPAAPPSSTPPDALQSIPTQLPTHIRFEYRNAMDDDPSLPDSLPPPTVRVNTTPPPLLSLSYPVASKKITTVSCPPKHRAIVATLVTLADGTPGKKVRMDDWISSLRCEYPGAREEFLLSVIATAEEDGVVMRGSSQDGVQWAWLNPEEDIQTVPMRLDSQPEPERCESPASPTADNYSVVQRAVVSVIQGLNGSVRTQVSVDSVCGALSRRKYASTRQGAVNMIAAARTAKVIRVTGDQILLEDPRLSRDGVLSSI